MTVKLVGARPETHVGLSTDSKPTGVPPGSRFIERDTGKEFITENDGTN